MWNSLTGITLFGRWKFYQVDSIRTAIEEFGEMCGESLVLDWNDDDGAEAIRENILLKSPLIPSFFLLLPKPVTPPPLSKLEQCNLVESSVHHHQKFRYRCLIHAPVKCCAIGC